jgi:hypothetical protein
MQFLYIKLLKKLLIYLFIAASILVPTYHKITAQSVVQPS